MTSGALIDTSFLITLVDANRRHHSIAGQYFRLALEQQVPLCLSVIVASEFAVKQDLTDLPLKQFRVLPFNLPHAVRAAEFWRQLERDEIDSRAVVRDDVKLLAQADKESVQIILSEDARTLHKYCERLRKQGLVHTRTVLLKDGFDPSGLRDDGQRGLDLPSYRPPDEGSPEE